MHDAFGAIDTPSQLSAVTETPGAVPVTSTVETATLTLPVLVTVTPAEPGAAPTATDPKSTGGW